MNFGEFFGNLKSYFESEREKAESDVEQTRKDAKAVLVRATWIGNMALLCVVVSFVLLLCSRSETFLFVRDRPALSLTVPEI